MKIFFKIVLLIAMPFFSRGQINPLFLETTAKQADSLKTFLAHTTNDTLQMEAMRDLTLHYLDINSDSAGKYVLLELPLVKKLDLKIWKADAYDLYSIVLNNKGDYPKSLEFVSAAMQIAGQENCEKNIWHIERFTTTGNARNARLSMLAAIQLDLGGLYRTTQDYDKQMVIHRESLKTASEINDLTIITIVNLNIGTLYRNKDLQDSALYYYNKSITNSAKCGYRKYLGSAYNGLAEIYLKQNNFSLVKQCLDSAIKITNELYNEKEKIFCYTLMAQYFSQSGSPDSALYYGYKAVALSKTVGQPMYVSTACSTLADIYRTQRKYDSAFNYLKIADIIKDSLNSSEKIRQFQNVGFNQQLKLQELEKEQLQTRNNIRSYTLLGGLGVILLVTLILYRNNWQKQKANKLLGNTLSDLQATQSQLIQSEKMASLGELTAGIAHEIQNPLNFVNNFSEVNIELVEEFKSQKSKLKSEEQDELLDDILSNSQKINHHGKRADAIVKGMLQHSRSSAGQKELTDINALCDEYLRLAYHGLRAKDKSFNATLKTDFDPMIGNINIIPQDIGRVILNLITNAFYAASLPSKGGFSDPDKSEGPTVWVSTKKETGKILISVKDNGPGIPSSIIDKIFQPFFTTKPTGQGTGLGLSMSYDIVKAHGGNINVETEPGSGTTFIIELPLTN